MTVFALQQPDPLSSPSPLLLPAIPKLQYKVWLLQQEAAGPSNQRMIMTSETAVRSATIGAQSTGKLCSSANSAQLLIDTFANILRTIGMHKQKKKFEDLNPQT